VSSTASLLLLVAVVIAGFSITRVSAADFKNGYSGLEEIADVVGAEIRAGRIPGAVVLVGHDGRIAYRRAFGQREIAPVRRPMTADTIFDLASLTKVVATTTAVMQLVEQGRLRLDDPAARFWPAFGSRGKDKIRVRDLLTHYSGLRPDLDLSTNWSGYGTALRYIAAKRPRTPPGEDFRYSDVNFEVLGELVRIVSGQPLDAYCTEHIFVPLAMHDTSFAPAPHKRQRIAPTTYAHGLERRGEVHDPTAHRMGGVAGHAGLFSTADDLALFAQMLLDGGRANGASILSRDSVHMMTIPQNPPGAHVPYGLGWDIASPFAATWRQQFSSASFGHTGYTGTSLWIDPASNTFVIILANRVHPNDKGDVQPLRKEIASLVAREFASRPTLPTAEGVSDGPATAADASTVQSGLDVLAAEGFAGLRGMRVALITNQSSRDSSGRHAIDLIRAAKDVQLVALFAPEHGLNGDVDGQIASGFEPITGVPLYSLYGKLKRPTPAMLDGVDALVFDIQDVGVRFYTYITTMAYAMEAAARKRIPFFVLDRPNPISAAVVQGPILDADLRSFTGYWPLPVRYGMTIGELAGLFNGENKIGADLRLVKMRNYRREQWHDETGLQWVNPSPNLRSLRAATLYPGVALVEGANVSVGRGTDTPFEVSGAPWVDAQALASYLNSRAIRGLHFAPVEFTPVESSFAGQRCHGVRVVLDDRRLLNAPALGLDLASALYRLYPGKFQIDRTLGLIGARRVVQAIKDGESPDEIVQRWQAPLDQFEGVRAKYLFY